MVFFNTSGENLFWPRSQTASTQQIPLADSLLAQLWAAQVRQAVLVSITAWSEHQGVRIKHWVRIKHSWARIKGLSAPWWTGTSSQQAWSISHLFFVLSPGCWPSCGKAQASSPFWSSLVPKLHSDFALKDKCEVYKGICIPFIKDEHETNASTRTVLSSPAHPGALC